MEEQAQRIAAIRARAAAEQQLVSNLNSKISDDFLKERLKLAANFLSDIETLFIPHAKEAATSGFMSMWLNQAEMTIQIAAQQRQIVQNIIDTYGPDAISIG